MGCCEGAPLTEDIRPGELTRRGSKIAHDRLRKMRDLDEATKIPFILVELRGEEDGKGFVEICGKDEYGVYSSLHEWLVGSFDCEQLDAGDLSDDTPLPFSDRSYKWGGYAAGETGEGTNSMGLSTMRLVDFMCNKLGWTLGVVNGGNVGKHGEIREQQVIFKAPHPMNLAVPHFMVELRSAGYVEVCGGQDQPFLEELENYLRRRFKAKRTSGHEVFCDRFYQCGDGVFKERGNKGENNMGLLTTELVDFVCKGKPWSLVTMNGGNYGESGTHREQQLFFRLDNHPLGASSHLMVELRGSGFVEVNGQDADDIYARLDAFLRGDSGWGCQEVALPPKFEAFSHKKYRWKAKDMVHATADVATFFHQEGWQMLLCSQGTVKVKGDDDSREQQMIFRPDEGGAGILEPHLVIDLYMGEGVPGLFEQPGTTQVLSNQRVRMRQVGDCSAAAEQFGQFLMDYFGAARCEDNSYSCDMFMCRGLTENNLGWLTMRICDFMVDRLGWSFVVCNVCNLGEFGQLREQQLIFRYDGERREIPVTKESELFAEERRGDYADFEAPGYWTLPAVRSGEQLQAMGPCDEDEKAALQEMLDTTFRRVLTRDRVHEFQVSSEEMPFRLELVHAFRSENVPLTHRFMQRREQYQGGMQFEAKTHAAGALLNSRLADGEALLFHGTNPSSSVSILKGGFVLSNAGKSTGTMFGYGVYLAECCSKSDEYARDDSGGTYPGLRSIVVCRALVGKPYHVHQAGDHIDVAREEGCDCVLGDRETKAGTYKELVFFDESQILPEYSIIYKRQYDPEKVPSHMRKKAAGTTGRIWQVKLDKGYANIPLDVNVQLLDAVKNGQSVLTCKMGAFDYEFDLDNKTQKNLSTGKVREVRPPRIS